MAQKKRPREKKKTTYNFLTKIENKNREKNQKLKLSLLWSKKTKKLKNQEIRCFFPPKKTEKCNLPDLMVISYGRIPGNMFFNFRKCCIYTLRVKLSCRVSWSFLMVEFRETCFFNLRKCCIYTLRMKLSCRASWPFLMVEFRETCFFNFRKCCHARAL